MGLLDDTKKVTDAVADELTDIDLSATRKQRFRINGDNNRILELNVSDMGIITRVNEIYPKLQKLAVEASKLTFDDDDESTLNRAGTTIKEIDLKMRELIDELFDSNVSEICAPSGSMYDPFDGKFRFEHIIESLAELYSNNFSEQFKKMSANVNKHTAKYTGMK